MQKSTDFLDELRAALRSCNLSEEEVPDKEDVLAKTKESFVVGNPRAWWNTLKRRPEIFEFENNTGYMHLEDVAPQHAGNIFFIADEDNEKKYVFDVPLDRVKEIVEECRYFEYYIVPHNFAWLIAENDHGNVLVMT